MTRASPLRSASPSSVGQPVVLLGPKTLARTCLVISSCSSRGNVEKVSNLVPIKKGIAVYATQINISSIRTLRVVRIMVAH